MLRRGERRLSHFYCPESNRIERTWLELHANVTRNHRCPTLRKLLLAVFAFLRAFNHREQVAPSLRRAPIRAA